MRGGRYLKPTTLAHLRQWALLADEPPSTGGGTSQNRCTGRRKRDPELRQIAGFLFPARLTSLMRPAVCSFDPAPTRRTFPIEAVVHRATSVSDTVTCGSYGHDGRPCTKLRRNGNGGVHPVPISSLLGRTIPAAWVAPRGRAREAPDVLVGVADHAGGVADPAAVTRAERPH